MRAHHSFALVVGVGAAISSTATVGGQPTPPAEAAIQELHPTRAACESMDSGAFFFPEGTFGDSNSKEPFVRGWYSSHLRAMSEPTLSCKQSATESYRFLWLRTWGAPIAVRVEVLGGAAAITAVELDGAGGYRPGKVARRVERKLTKVEWAQVSDGLVKIEFWKTPTREGRGGLDGAQWVLEGRKGSQYHVVDRWTPQGGDFRELCLSLLKLADMLPEGTGRRGRIY